MNYNSVKVRTQYASTESPHDSFFQFIRLLNCTIIINVCVYFKSIFRNVPLHYNWEICKILTEEHDSALDVLLSADETSPFTILPVTGILEPSTEASFTIICNPTKVILIQMLFKTFKQQAIINLIL